MKNNRGLFAEKQSYSCKQFAKEYRFDNKNKEPTRVVQYDVKNTDGQKLV